MRRDHVLQFVLEAAQTPDFQGVTAQAVADALSIWRNDAAVELNKLVAEGKLRRVGKKNVRFFPASEETADIRPEPAVQEEPPQAEEETGQYRAFSGLVGADGSLKYQLRVAMAAVAYPPNGLNMLITGSTGSGKSHFARTIWEYAKETKALCGAHAPIPFVEFNCAEYADNPQLLLSHLFGYKKGAFTGALEDKPGLVEQANGGILFLDEIHGLSSTGQEMFFSLLDTGVFRRVGDNTPRTSRFMLIGATTKPLTDLLETFLRRMPVLISMPTLSDRPMKERLELVEHFYAEEAAHIGRTLRIQKGALNSILDYSLHSNLGVLKNLVQLSCAKAFLRENVAGNRTGEIAVTFSDLSFQTYNVSAETEKYAHGVQIGKARVIELRVLLLRLPEVRHEQRPASGAPARAQAVRRILDHGALRRRSAQLPRRLEENVRLRLRAADHVAGNDRSKILQQSDPFQTAAHDGRRRRRRDCNRGIPRAQLLQQPLRAFFCRSCSIGVKILQIGLLVLQDSVRIRAEFLPEPFDPRLVVESEADDRHPLHIGNAGLLARITKTLPDHTLAVHEHAIHVKDHRIHMHTSRIRLHAPEYNAPGKKKQVPPCADRGKRQPTRPIDRSGSDCQKSLAEFALASAKKVEIIFSGGVYVGENTARLANVRRACPSCAAASRSPFQTRAQ